MTRNLPDLLPKGKSPDSSEDSDDLADCSSEEDQDSQVLRHDKNQSSLVDTEMLFDAWKQNWNIGL